MSVGVVPVGATGAAATNPTAAITFGTEQFSIGNLARQKITEVQDNYTLPWNAHTFTFGARFEYTNIYNNFPQGLGGVWVFPNIAALNNKAPSGYAVGYPNSGNAADIPASFTTNQYSMYAQDQWSSRNGFTVTAGLRADIPIINGAPPENTNIANLFANSPLPQTVHTSWSPKTRVLFSPRVGFNWDVRNDQTAQLRGNMGVFTNPPPFILVANALQNTGLGLVRLSCTGAATPDFTIDQANLPHACKGQAPPAPGAAGTGGINLNDPNFKYPQTFIGSGGFDYQLPFGFTGTFEGLYHKAINGLRIRDLNLAAPRNVGGQVYTDRNGRVLYADTILANGSINTAIGTANSRNGRSVTAVNGTNFVEGAIYLTNQSKDYNYALTGQLRRSFGALDLTTAYTYNRAYEVQALTSDRAISNWRNGREYSGLESADELTTSSFERRHRIVAYGKYTMPWLKTSAPTDVTFYFERQSGPPVTYVSGLDLNGDAFAGNDPIYVPKSALDPNEIKIGSYNATTNVFTQDAAASQAFEDFIAGQPCLNAQRGTIMQRNSCFNPWQNRLDMSVRQQLPQIRGQRASVQLDIINAANAVGRVLQHVDGHERNWGTFTNATLSAFTQQTVLAGNNSSSSARTTGPINQSMPVYTFNSTVRTRGPFDFSNNLGYLMQLSFRYEF